MKRIKIGVKPNQKIFKDNRDSKGRYFHNNGTSNFILNEIFSTDDLEKVNSYLIEIFYLYLEHIFQSVEYVQKFKVYELVNLINENPFIKKGTTTYNILNCQEDIELENGKLLSYYNKHKYGAIEIFRYYIDEDDFIMTYCPEYLDNLREEKIDKVLDGESK